MNISAPFPSLGLGILFSDLSTNVTMWLSRDGVTARIDSSQQVFTAGGCRGGSGFPMCSVRRTGGLVTLIPEILTGFWKATRQGPGPRGGEGPPIEGSRKRSMSPSVARECE